MNSNNNCQIKINTNFDAGSIEVLQINSCVLDLKLRCDTNSHFSQWFYFQLNNVKSQNLQINIHGISSSAYPEGFINYKPCISYDNKNWQRINSNLKSDILSFELTPLHNTVYLAYFEPYPYTRHLELIGYANNIQSHNNAIQIKHEVIGYTTEGRNIDLLKVGNPDNCTQKIWITARQHPGETMASWFMEGLIYNLLDLNQAISQHLLKNCVFYLVLNMNVDGSIHGNLRTNAKGINLNREWHTMDYENSPEVAYVKQYMLKEGVDMFFDIHGDESIPYVFAASCEANPSFSTRQRELINKFKHHYELINPDFQSKHGYEVDHFHEDYMKMATNFVGDKFNCLAITLEMPFKDNDNLPNYETGWNGIRSANLGKDLLRAINFILND